ncbi:Small-conductance mechanosensitive channel [Halopseudomonas litoralis]|uniref:Small-conductance mechanosensitive channel n=1 Tax=Halopseudomonas litoralis TaxID=797277 RepID=A0A1H1MMK5_9GAMM|nr:mechanosensitive ion channel domain-containing protein [Halopseudomonas litoralis]SDR87179.1 Small-conductance mechanosensitive channel [Halopseudomonas litoralis]
MLRPKLPGFVVFLLALLFVPVAAVSAQTADQTELDPAQARQVLDTLQDDERRDEVVRALEVIASEAPVDDEAPAAEAETPLSTIVPLEADGLVARTLAQIGGWADGLRAQLKRIAQALGDLPHWFQTTFLNEVGHMLALQTLIDLGIVFGVGLCLEWLLRRVLRRSVRSLLASANQAELRVPVPAPVPLIPDITDPVVLAALRPLDSNTALVQAQRDGVEYVEAVRVGAHDSGADSTLEPAERPVPAASMLTAAPPVESELKALRRLPFALAGFVLDLLPLGLFFGIAALVLELLPGLDARTHLVTREFIYAYVITRVVMAVVRLLLAPADPCLRIIQLGDFAAEQIHRWTRRLVILATFGVAIGNALGILGTGPEAQLVIVKTTSLLVHLTLIFLVFRFRESVAVWIAGAPERDGAIYTLRRWLAGIWPLLMAVLIMGGWVVWALRIEDGFTKLLEFIGMSAAIIVLGRLAAVLVLGALGRLAGISEDVPDEPSPDDNTLRSQLAEQYYPLLRWLVSLVITAATLVALLQAWGLNALQWFAPGTIGSSLASAFVTIFIAVAIALVIWQATNSSIQKRITRWREQGDLLRAARLNTLLPMLRAGLLILIALIVGLTTLNQIGVNTTPLIAGASIIGVAIGFGSQKLVQDFITGMFLLMENAMQVGDSVTVAGVEGTVENLSIRTVRLRAGNGSLHIVPFSSVTTVNNANRGIGNAAVRISVSYDTDINQAISELKAIGAALRNDPVFSPQILADMEIWGVDAVDGSMVTLAGQMRCTDKGRWGVQREINRRVLERFRQLGIDIADPRERPLMPSSSAANSSDEG